MVGCPKLSTPFCGKPSHPGLNVAALDHTLGHNLGAGLLKGDEASTQTSDGKHFVLIWFWIGF
jgi:hypothetical protein